MRGFLSRLTPRLSQARPSVLQRGLNNGVINTWWCKMWVKPSGFENVSICFCLVLPCSPLIQRGVNIFICMQEMNELASDLYNQSMFVHYLTKKCDYKYVVYEDSWEIFDPRAWYVLACCRGAFVMITWDLSQFLSHRSCRCKCISMSCWLLHLFKIKTIHIVPSGLQRLRGSRKVKPRKSQRRKHIWTYLLQRISSSKREYSFLPSSIRG